MAWHGVQSGVQEKGANVPDEHAAVELSQQS